MTLNSHGNNKAERDLNSGYSVFWLDTKHNFGRDHVMNPIEEYEFNRNGA